MKKLFLLTMAALALSPNALAESKGGGGGNIGGTPDFVLKSAVSEARSDFAITMNSLLSGDSISQKLKMKNHHVAEVFIAWRAESNGHIAILEDIENTSLNLVPGDCQSNDEGSVDASTLYAKAAPICISINRLKRLPESALSREIKALLAHEFAHHFGFSESEAQSIQRYFAANDSLFGAIGEWIEVKKQIDLLKVYLPSPGLRKLQVVPRQFMEVCTRWSNVAGLVRGMGLMSQDTPSFCRLYAYPTRSTLIEIDQEAVGFEQTLMSNEYNY